MSNNYERKTVTEMYDGKIAEAIKQMVYAGFSMEENGATEATISLSLYSNNTQTPTAMIFTSRPDPCFEVSDYEVWKEAVFRCQINELFKFMHKRDEVPKKLRMLFLGCDTEQITAHDVDLT